MADNFDLRKFLIENKLTASSILITEENRKADKESLVKEEINLSLPESEFWEKYQVNAEEYFNMIGDVPQEIIDDEDEGNGSRFLEYLEKRGIKPKHIGELPTGNTSAYGAEVYDIYDIGHGYFAAVDDYTNYYAIGKSI